MLFFLVLSLSTQPLVLLMAQMEALLQETGLDSYLQVRVTAGELSWTTVLPELEVVTGMPPQPCKRRIARERGDQQYSAGVRVLCSVLPRAFEFEVGCGSTMAVSVLGRRRRGSL